MPRTLSKGLRPLRIAVTTGDPAGVGPEVLRAALASPLLNKEAIYEVVGDLENAAPGLPTPDGARAALHALESAVAGAIEGKFDAVVTGPIHKARMREVGFDFPGQTEFFAARTATADHVMCLTGCAITVALATAHIPYHQVPRVLSPNLIFRAGSLLADFLKLRNGGSPRIALAGLNPHAGESGLLGSEEESIIGPALLLLQKSGAATFSGPWSADTLFYRTVSGEFDGVVCMYHDQGLIPLKLHAFHEGVNVTLGLPFPRTSPDHGTAFEIAGRGVADPRSMIAALNLAAELVLKRRAAQTP